MYYFYVPGYYRDDSDRSGKRLTIIQFFHPFIAGPLLMESYRAIGQHLRTPLNPPQLQTIQLKGRFGVRKEDFEGAAAKRREVPYCDYNTAENNNRSGVPGVRNFGGTYLCLEWIGSEYRADGELPELTLENFEH